MPLAPGEPCGLSSKGQQPGTFQTLVLTKLCVAVSATIVAGGFGDSRPGKGDVFAVAANQSVPCDFCLRSFGGKETFADRLHLSVRN